MKQNVGRLDRAIRLVLAGLLFLGAAGGFFSPAISMVFALAALALGLSAAFGWCGLYMLFKKSTCCGGCGTKKDAPEESA